MKEMAVLQSMIIFVLLLAASTRSYAFNNIGPDTRIRHASKLLTHASAVQPIDETVTSNITTSSTAPANPAVVKHKRQRIPILSYKDNYVIVSKPAGVSMHKTGMKLWGHAAKFPSLEKLIRKQLSRKPYLVHRLDHRTSGAVLMGFDSQTAGKLHGRLRGDGAVKLYIALVRGDLRERFASSNAAGERLAGIHHLYGKITIDLPIIADDVEKEAITDFYFLSSIDLNDKFASNEGTSIEVPFSNKALSLLLCRPRTGRIHQIRRHLVKGLNSPVIGDTEHGDSRVNRFWRETIGLDRLALHCWHLYLPPIGQNDESFEDDEVIQCIAPLPDDFADALHHPELKQLWNEATQLEPRLKMQHYDERGGTFGRNCRTK
jgi:tRNA pseudouridine65 synthase